MARRTSHVAAAHAQSAEETVPLPGLVTEAEGRHPEIVRARHTVSAAREVPSRVGSLPDPPGRRCSRCLFCLAHGLILQRRAATLPRKEQHHA